MASRSLTFACLVSAGRQRLAGERGFTIIEVLVSAVLIVIAGLGTFAAFDSAGATSGRNKERTIAAGLAQSDQERVRSKTALQLAALTDASETTPKTVNDTRYTIVSAATWVTDASGTSSCSGMGDEAGYMRITSTVTWTNMHTLSPVKVDSIKSVPNGGYKTSRGSLAVKVLSRDGLTGVAGVDVTITGPRNYSASTNTNGCVVLGFVPVGTYTVSISKAGYVRDKLPNAQVSSETVQVAGEQTGSAAFNYDQPGSLAVKFMTRVPPGTATADVPATGDGFTVANSGLGSPNTRKFGPFTAAATQATRTATTPTTAQKLLFPFTSAYGVWAGTCAQNDPTLPANGGFNPPTASGNGTGLVPANGAVSPDVVAFEPMIKVFVNRYTSAPPSTATGLITGQAARVVVKPVVTGCTAAYARDTAYSSTLPANNGTIPDASQPTLPYGQYTVCAQDSATSPTRRSVVQTIDNKVRNGTSVTLTLPNGPTNPAAC